MNGTSDGPEKSKSHQDTPDMFFFLLLMQTRQVLNAQPLGNTVP